MFIVIAPYLRACDVCSGGGAVNFMGILPQFQKNFVGLRYQHRSFKNNQTNGLDYFNSIDIWARFNPNKNWQVFAFLPYQINRRKAQGVSTPVQGLGDATFMAGYFLLNNSDSMNSKVKCTWMLGAGTQLPFGNTKATTWLGLPADAVLQPGTGAIGGNIFTTFTLRNKKWGFASDAQIRAMTTNNAGYQFGNRINASLRVFRTYSYKNCNIIPQFIGSIETSKKDISRGIPVNESGGSAAFIGGGCDFFGRNIAMGISIIKSLNIKQNNVINANGVRATLSLTKTF
jgi:hypothetical protein